MPLWASASLTAKFRYRKVNQVLADINGKSIEEHQGKHLREVVPKLAPTLEPMFQQIMRSGMPYVDIAITGQTAAYDSSSRRFQATYSPMRDEKGELNGILAIVRDITGAVRNRTTAAAGNASGPNRGVGVARCGRQTAVRRPD